MSTTHVNETHKSGVKRRTGAASPSISHVTPRPFLDPIRQVKRQSIHWKRKVFHVIGIGTAGVAYLLTAVTSEQALTIMAPFAALFIALDLLRFKVPALNKKVKKDFGALMRDYELDGLSGSSWFFLVALLCFALFPGMEGKLAVSLGIIFLAIGDPIASFVGVRWGKIKIPGGKSLEGSLALFGVCSLVGLGILLGFSGFGLQQALIVAPLAALAAAFAEWLPVKKLDDNFTMPLLTSAATMGLLALVC